MLISDSSASWSTRKGFSLIEITVSVGVLLILSGVILTYSRESSRSIEFANQQSGLISLIHRSKALSQSFRNEPPAGRKICSYGVHIDANNSRAFIFQDLIESNRSCSESDNAYTAAITPSEALDGEANNFSVRPGFRFGPSRDVNSPGLVNVVFIPPDPEVVLNNNRAIRSAMVAVEDSRNADAYFSIRVNKFGQINIE